MASWAIDFLATAPPEDAISGLSRTVWELAVALAARGHRVRVLYPAMPYVPAPPYRGVERVPVPILPKRNEPYGRERAIARTASELFDREADVIVANDEKGGAITLPRGRRAGRPVFVMMVHDIQQHHLRTMRALTQPRPTVRQRIGTWLDRRAIARLESTAFGQARAILLASEPNRALLLRYYSVPTAKLHVVPHPVPPLPEVGDRTACREALHVPLDVPVVSFIGRTPDRQGLPIALEAFRRVRVLFPGSRFLVVGSTGTHEPGVMYQGVTDEATKARVLVASDVFLFPARYEGFGLAPREAMRAGVATVVSPHVPFDGSDGASVVRVIREDDPGGYASELAGLLADPAGTRALGERGRRYAEQFSVETMATRFEAILAPLLAP